MVAEQGKERHNAVAKGYALHHGPDTQMAETKEITLDGMIEPVDEQTDDEEQHRTLDDAAYHLRGGFELRLHQRKITRDSHDEEEKGKHEVAGCHAVPLRVSKHFERLAPAIVDENHACHSDTTQDIKT